MDLQSLLFSSLLLLWSLGAWFVYIQFASSLECVRSPLNVSDVYDKWHWRGWTWPWSIAHFWCNASGIISYAIICKMRICLFFWYQNDHIMTSISGIKMKAFPSFMNGLCVKLSSQRLLPWWFLASSIQSENRCICCLEQLALRFKRKGKRALIILHCRVNEIMLDSPYFLHHVGVSAVCRSRCCCRYMWDAACEKYLH